jgi:hypothetical protein
MADNNNIDDIIKKLLDQAASGGSYVPGQAMPTTKQAIGVKGTLVFDPLTNEQVYSGYKVKRSSLSPGGPGGMVEVQPRYFSGDEDTIAGFSKEEIALVQAQMKSNGLISGKYTPGIVDNKTRSGFRNLLGISNRMGQDWQTTMASVSQAKATEQTLRPYSVDNADDLKAVFRKTAQEMLGRNLQDGDLDSMVQAFQQSQTQYQRRMATSSGMIEQAPSATTFAQTQIEKDFGPEVDTRKIDKSFALFDKIAGSK